MRVLVLLLGCLLLASSTSAIAIEVGLYGMSTHQHRELWDFISKADVEIAVAGVDRFEYPYQSKKIVDGRKLRSLLMCDNQSKNLVVYFYKNYRDLHYPGFEPSRLVSYKRFLQRNRKLINSLNFKRVIWLAQPAMQGAWYVMEDSDER